MSFTSTIVCSVTLACAELLIYADKPLLWVILLAGFLGCTSWLKLKPSDTDHERVVVRACAILFVLTPFAVNAYIITAIHLVYLSWVNLDKSTRTGEAK